MEVKAINYVNDVSTYISDMKDLWDLKKVELDL